MVLHERRGNKAPAASEESTLWSRIKKRTQKNSHLILNFPMGEGVSEVSEGVSEVSEQTNECSGACEQSEHGGASR